MQPSSTWTEIFGPLGAAAAVAALLTWPVSAVALRRYRAAVHRGMQRVAGCNGPAAPPPFCLPDSPPVSTSPLCQRVRKVMRQARVAYAVAALAFGVTGAVIDHVSEGLDWHPVRALTLTLYSAWLLVPTVTAVGITRRRVKAGLWSGYVALLVLLALIGPNGVRESLELLALSAGIPALFIVATSAPPIRGAAWLVAPTILIGTFGLVAGFPVPFYLWYRMPWDATAVLDLVALLTALIALSGYVWTILWRYTHKRASEQTLLVTQWWFVLALYQALFAGYAAPGRFLVGFLPFIVFAIAVPVLLRPLYVDARPHPAVRLLLLRAFGHRRRSTRLLRDLTATWRWIGSIELLAGTDLATETVEPNEFLDFVRRRTDRHFVANQADLERYVAELDLEPDRDGRYRINELFCHGDVWQAAFAQLAAQADAVLVDLRGLTRHNTGVTYEMEQIVARVPLDQVVVLVDKTTDPVALQAALTPGFALAPAVSPVGESAVPGLQLLSSTGRATVDAGRLLDTLCDAAWSKVRTRVEETAVQSRPRRL